METQKLIQLTGVNSSHTNGIPIKGSFTDFVYRKGLLSRPENLDVGRIVCIDYSASALRQLRKLRLDRENCTLLRMEPSVVLPANYSKSRLRQFGKIITVGGTSVMGSTRVNWPLVWPTEASIESISASDRLERVVLINGNKMSLIKGELYSLRRRAIRKIANLDLYGTDWDSKFFSRMLILARNVAHSLLSLRIPRLSGISLWFQAYPQSKGHVKDKISTMAKYKYALVIENSAEYMSEKLMEALFAGCIPIYVGSNIEDFGIPVDLVVRARPDITSIHNALIEASGWNFEDFHRKLKTFLRSKEVRDTWDHQLVYQKLLEEIQKK